MSYEEAVTARKLAVDTQTSILNKLRPDATTAAWRPMSAIESFANNAVTNAIFAEYHALRG